MVWSRRLARSRLDCRPSALDGATTAQSAALVALVAAACGIAATTAVSPIAVVAVIVGPIFLSQFVLAIGAAIESRRPDAQASGRSAPRGPGLPSFTVLVPLFREVRVVRQLVGSLSMLDYPPDRLEILFLVEADDPETRAALEAAPLRPQMAIVVVEPGGPKTKPNALNVGLARATGELLTIYDAEDLPDPSQLRAAARLFAGLPEDVACLQARLVIDNAADGWLALMAAVEYAGLFDSTKAGLAQMRLPVALGGSSNHFRTAWLREVGGWDAWNVTEDADIGLQLAARRLFVADLASETREEAPFRLSDWLAQRRRWHKGFIQTAFAHTRRPMASMRAAGPLEWATGIVQVGAPVLSALLFPVFLGDLIHKAFWRGFSAEESALLIALDALTLWVFACGFLSVLLPAAIGMRRRRLWPFAPWLATLPFYMLLTSIAAWGAVVDYVRRPFHWRKTEHGLATRGR